MKKDILWMNYGFLMEKEELWFVPFGYNCLCRYDFKSKQIKDIHWIPKSTVRMGGYYNIARKNNTIIIIPAREKSIWLYEIEDETFKEIELKEYVGCQEKFQEYAVWEDFLYLFPLNYPYLVKLNLKSHEVQYVRCGEEMIETGNFACVSLAQVEDTVFCVQGNNNHVIKYDMIRESFGYVEVGQRENHYKTIEIISKDIILVTDKNGKIYLINEEGDIKKEFEVKINELKEGYTNSIRHEEYIYFFPYEKGKKIIGFNLKNYMIEEAVFNDKIKDFSENHMWIYNVFSNVQKNEKNMVFVNISQKSLIIVSLENMKVDHGFLEIKIENDDLLKRIFIEYGKINEFFYIEGENIYSNIDVLLKGMELNGEKENKKNLNTGKYIYENLIL